MPTKKVPAEQTKEVGFLKPQLAFIDVRLKGLTPLVCHEFGQKVAQQLEEKTTGKAKAKKEARDPDAEFEAAKYHIGKGIDGFPARGIKTAVVDSASFMSRDITKVSLRGAFFVNIGDELVMIANVDGKPLKATKRRDVVRVGGRGGPGTGAADVRYRPQYDDWFITIRVTFATNVFTVEQILNLLEAAGLHIGIGECRPQKGGQWGMFCVDRSRSMQMTPIDDVSGLFTKGKSK